jgi:hypothetical protein
MNRTRRFDFLRLHRDALARPLHRAPLLMRMSGEQSSDLDDLLARLIAEGRIKLAPDRRTRVERRDLGYGGRRATDRPRPSAPQAASETEKDRG